LRIRECVNNHSIPQYTTLDHSIPQYTTLDHSIPQYTTVYHSTPQYTTVYHSTPQYTTVHHSISQYTTLDHSISQYTSTTCHLLDCRRNLEYYDMCHHEAIQSCDSDCAASAGELIVKIPKVTIKRSSLPTVVPFLAPHPVLSRVLCFILLYDCMTVHCSLLPHL